MQLSGFSTNGSGSLNTIVCEKLLFKPNFVQDSFIIGMTILCSVILYGSGNLRYIDALLLASGSCTQTGLQPVDLTQISIYQQVCIFLNKFFNYFLVNYSPFWSFEYTNYCEPGLDFV